MGNLRPVEERRKRLWAYGAGAALTFLVLYVFYRLQDYGPESAVRRFHVDVQRQDWRDLTRVTLEPLGSAEPQALMALVNQYVFRGASYKLLAMQRSPEQVRAVVEYSFPTGDKLLFPWIIEKTGRSWRVNTRKTVTLLREMNRQ